MVIFTPKKEQDFLKRFAATSKVVDRFVSNQML
ncbi:uncharacterized protein METZ01_LOCUS429829 [marine metagenome]|uniref:Uncharacterized protein n=1 Tax=marine metagenome TaxID=408172 RepID=A0A382Y270_9ZZZZ